MLTDILEHYLKSLTETSKRGDAREETFYKHLDELIEKYTELQDIKKIDITILPKKTEAGSPDFRIWDGKSHITGYIEAKAPSVTTLDDVEDTDQLKRYLTTFPNVILTNFYEFRLYRNGQRIAQAMIARPVIANKLQTTPPLENVENFKKLFDLFFSFSQPKVQTARSLAVELAKRTRFLRDQVIIVEMQENDSKGHKQILGFYEAFKKYLIATLTEKQFADLYAQTVTYGLFAARTRADGDFNRRLAFDYIPHTIGILRDVFRFISLEEPPKSLHTIVDDIAEILNVADAGKILHEYQRTGKGRDPIIHFYETFLATFDPGIREKRGVYYTPEAVVGYIVRSIHSILKTNFDLSDGLASEQVKLLDPAGGTLTFPAEAIRLAASEYEEKYGEGALYRWIKNHILANFYAFELMMAPYAIGHLKIGFIFDELGYKMSDDERFKLYLTNTLEMEEIEQIAIPGLSSLSEESHLAGEVKKEQPVLVILGNPPYSGISANINEWTEQLLKEDIDGTQSFYKVDDQSLGEKNPKWLQDDYVKFLRFAQWKIQKSGHGIVGMITNHSYLDNPTFRGMRQSLMKTFDEIYILDLHGNSLKKETTPEGGKDENVFDIRQGVAIALFVKNKQPQKTQVFHTERYGLRKEKYQWLDGNYCSKENYAKITPQSPYYFFVKRETQKIKRYLKWKKVDEIFPVNSVGIVTARDNFVIGFKKEELKNRILQFKNLSIPIEIISQTYNLKDKTNWKIHKARETIENISNINANIKKILYRPFDTRYIFYHRELIERMRPEVMRHMLDNNICLITPKRVETKIPWQHCFCSKTIVEHVAVSQKTIDYVFPLYLYLDKTKKQTGNPGSTVLMVFDEQESYGKKPNISPIIFEKLEKAFNNRPSPEEIFYYIYGIFYSNIYRETYAEFLKIDFPRVPFTADYELFKEISKLGNRLADLHLLKAPALDALVAKYRGSSTNDRIEKISYNKDKQRIYINKEKYFEGITPKVWNFHIGGYQVLQKYLKDRKGRDMDTSEHFCRIATALRKTLDIQKKIDSIYPKIEKYVITF